MIVGLAYFSTSVTMQNQSNENFDPKTVFWSHIHGIGFDPDNRTTLFIATHGDFYQSINGETPIKVNQKRADYMAFNAPPKPGFPLYASGHPETGGNTGLIQSSDGGKTWQHISNVTEPPADFHSMSVSKTDPKVIIGFDSGTQNLFKTIDGGKTWQVLPHPDHISTVVISPHEPDLLLVGTDKGMFKSIDGGQVWKQIGSYKNLNIHALAFDENSHLFGSIDTFGIVRSQDLGETWETIGKTHLTVTSIAPDSQNKIIYLAGYSSEGFQEVYKFSYDLNSLELVGTNKELN